jgi:putative DNA primase/helicase
MFSCNSLPESYDDSDAFHKRWIIAQFENVFSGDKKDPQLIEKLTAPEELSGFFNKSIAEYREMDKRGTFTGEGTTTQKRDYYTKLSDPVQCFIEDQVLFNPDGMVIKRHLYEQFRNFCQQHGYGKTFTQKYFFKKFREKVGDQLYESYVKDSEGVQRRIYKGINLEGATESGKQTKLGENSSK